MGGHSDKPLLVKGKRLDGRKPDELRPMSAKAGVIPSADGSAEFRLGETVAVAAVYGPKKVLPKHFEEADRAYLNVTYDMASFSTSDRAKPGPSRRSKEISKVLMSALAPIIYLEKYPQTEIEVFIEVVNANAGTRTAALNAAAIALADAGIEMKSMISSIAAGKVDDEIVLDLFQDEDNFGQADLPVAIIAKTGEFSLLQMDGDMTKEEIKKAFGMAKKACKEIYEAQRKALLERYESEISEEVEKDEAN